MAALFMVACSDPVVWRQAQPGGAAPTGSATDEAPRCVPATVLHTDDAITSDSSRPPLSVATLQIHDLQGRGHSSPYAGAYVASVAGIVTALTPRGFALQSEVVDHDLGTSEAIFVTPDSEAAVAVGDRVAVSGTVTEQGPPPDLTVTQLAQASVVVRATHQPLPEPVRIGHGGRCPPTEVIDAPRGEAAGSSAFDPVEDAIDFYESLEAMRVTVEEAIAASGTNGHGEIAVLPNRGTWATHRTERGGVYVTPDDKNPERILVDGELVPGEPEARTGDRFMAPITGVLAYSYGNFKLLSESPLASRRASSVEPGQTDLVGDDRHLTIATLNVQNLAPDDSPRLVALGTLFAVTLRAPDIIVLQEVQDDNGPAPGVLTADKTYSALVAAVTQAGGPSYQWRDIPPSAENADGGLADSNIRVGLLFNPKRVTFVDRGSARPTDAASIRAAASGPVLALSPVRLAPSDPAWLGSRKPLVAEFEFNGQRLILVGCHFRSKLGDTSLFGAEQPPLAPSSSQRLAQALVVAHFVDGVLSSFPDARVAVLGDLNDFDFSETLDTLVDASLTRLADALSPEQRYSFVYDGNAQLLDHVLVSPALRVDANMEIVHGYADSSAQGRATDHDPVVARLRMAP